jgi:hypothetical protein
MIHRHSKRARQVAPAGARWIRTLAVGLVAAWVLAPVFERSVGAQATTSVRSPSSQGASALAPDPKKLEDQRRTQAARQAELDKREGALDDREKDAARGRAKLDERQKQAEAALNRQKERLDAERFGDKGPIGENGISIGRAKVFDNRTLTLLLENLSDTLKGLQVIDQDPLKKALGLLQGSQTRDVARMASLLAGGSPKVVTSQDGTSQGDLQQTLTRKNGTDDGKKSESVEALIDRKISDNLSLKQETTASERNPALPTLPDLMGAPSGLPAFGQNAADLLTDQVNLTYQILNLRMVLEGSLSDRLIKGKARLQAVLGFNVSIDPPRDAENSAAVVEVTVETVGGQPVSLVSLMPQEKTYNSVAINTKSNAYGGSAVAGMFTVGYSERRREQLVYLYRDNDTLSFERMITKGHALTFGWQFRPVLGRKSVSPGMRQMFAVVSLPVSNAGLEDGEQQLTVSLRTYWRKYYGDTLTTSDRKQVGPWPYLRRAATLGLSEAVPNAKEGRRVDTLGGDLVNVPRTAEYQNGLQPRVAKVDWSRIDDKTALIAVQGDNFFSGTSVAMGGTSAASGVVIKSSQAMDIVTAIENIGAGTPMVIGRYGTAQPLAVRQGNCIPEAPVGATLGPALGGQRELRVPLSCPIADIYPNLVVFANGKPVPGVPQILERTRTVEDPDDRRKTIKLPESLVITQVPVSLFPKGEGMLAVVSPFTSPFRLEFPWYDDPYVLKRVAADKKTIIFVQRNDALSLTSVAFGPSAETRWKAEYGGTPYTATLVGNTILKLELPADAQGALTLFEPLPGDRFDAYLIDLPAAKPKAKEAIEPVEGVALVVNQNDAPKLTFTGERIGDVATVRVEGREPFKIETDDSKKTLAVWIPQDATKLVAKLALRFSDAAGKSIGTQTLEVKVRPKDKSDTPKSRPR